LNQFTDEISWQILIVDDQTPCIKTICKHLESLPAVKNQEAHHIEVAQDISSALAQMKSKIYDVLIIDPASFDSKNSLNILEKFNNACDTTGIIILSDAKQPDWLSKSAQMSIQGVISKSSPNKDITCQMVTIAVNKNRQNNALWHEGQKYKYIIDNIPDAYYEVDLKGTYTYANKACVRHFARPLEEILGANHTLTTPPHCHDGIVEKFSRLYKERKDMLIDDIQVLRPDGSTVYVEIMASVLKNRNGKPIGFFGMSRDVTDKKIAQEALRQSEEKHRTILENMEDAYFEVNLNDQLVFFSDSLCAMTGYSKEELLNLKTSDLMDEENDKKTKKLYRTVFKTGKSKFLQYEIIRKDGAVRYHESTISLNIDKNGKPIGFRGVSRDLTQNLEAREALKKSEEKYKSILNNIEDGYFEVDLKGKLQFFNDSMMRMLGYPADELMTMHYKTYMDPENSEKVFEAFNKIYRAVHSNMFLQYEIIKKDGTRAYHEVTVSLIRNKSNQPVGFRGVARDLTEKKVAQKALKDSEEKYRNILASIEDGYFEVDNKGRLQFFNDAMAKIIGYPEKDLLGMGIDQYMDNKNIQKVYKTYNVIFHEEKSRKDLQYEITQQDGSKRSVESSVSLIRNLENKIIGFRGIARDITERKRVEAELRHAKKAAEAASQAKSEFLANMSHEIRTPMNGVLGMYNLLLGTDMTDVQTDYVETGKRSAEALLHVINDILDFSKIEAGKLDIEIIDFDLRKSIEEIVTLPAIQAHTKGLEFIYEVGNDVPTLLKGDPGRLRQIIMNLCTNAIKFTHQGEVVFRTSLVEENKSWAKLYFSVQDTGIGISSKDQKRLFSSFEQVDASTTRKYGGTGLGLAISKKLVELMGGEISIKSTRGKGATFWFTCIFDKQKEVALKTNVFEDIHSIQDKRILIVDDNQTNLIVLSGYLQHWGCSCDTALSAEMGLSLMRAVAKAKAPYDLVISDMLMPQMDGAQFGRLIKSDPDLKSSQMIMLTSQGLRGDASEMRAIGFDAYLNKPVRRSLLYDCLITVINKKVDEKLTAPPKQIVTSYSISEEKRRRLKILLAEDNMVNQKVALALLKKFGLQVDAVNNGKLAVQALEKKDYNIVLMDIQMPEMDGICATKIIRDPDSNVKNHEVLIIAMTAHAMKGDKEMCLKAGMDDYISKPIRPESLLKVIESNIQKL